MFDISILFLVIFSDTRHALYQKLSQAWTHMRSTLIRFSPGKHSPPEPPRYSTDRKAWVDDNGLTEAGVNIDPTTLEYDYQAPLINKTNQVR